MREEELVLKTAKFISDTNLVAGTWGNVSVRSGDLIYITPSGIPYDELRLNQIAVVSLKNGEQIGGSAKASSELPLHLEIYRNLEEINAVVHFHSVYASAFASMRKPIPCYVEDQAQIVGGEIDVAEYAPPGTLELAENALKTMGSKFGVLLANHGAVAIGRSAREALICAQIIEKSAQIAFIVKDDGIPLKPDEIARLRSLYLESYSTNLLD